MTVARTIDDKGGAAAVALATGKKPGAVRLWKHRNQFPRDAWPELMQAYPDLTLARLLELEAPPLDVAAPESAPIPETEAA